MKPVINPNDVHCEIYNPNDYEVVFTRMDAHVERRVQAGLTPGPLHIVCKPDDFCYLPHQFYTVWCKSGSQEIRLIKNFGDDMFKGNKKPSAPEAWVKKFF